MDRRRTKIYANKNRIAAILTIPPTNMDRIVLLEYFASADDVHTKYFHRRQQLACLRSWIQFNFAGKPTVKPGADYDPATNVHIICNVVPGYAGGYVPGMSAA